MEFARIVGTKWHQLGTRKAKFQSGKDCEQRDLNGNSSSPDLTMFKCRDCLHDLGPRKANRSVSQTDEWNLSFAHQFLDHADRWKIQAAPKLLLADEFA